METGQTPETQEAPKKPFHQSAEWLSTIRSNRGKITPEKADAIARDVIANSLTLADAAKKYSTSTDTINHFKKRFIASQHRGRSTQKSYRRNGSKTRSGNRQEEIKAHGLVDSESASKMLGISRGGIHSAVNSGRLKPVRLFGPKGNLAFDRLEIARFIREGRRKNIARIVEQPARITPAEIQKGLGSLPPVPVQGLLALQHRVESLETDVALLKKALR